MATSPKKASFTALSSLLFCSSLLPALLWSQQCQAKTGGVDYFSEIEDDAVIQLDDQTKQVQPSFHTTESASVAIAPAPASNPAPETVTPAEVEATNEVTTAEDPLLAQAVVTLDSQALKPESSQVAPVSAETSPATTAIAIVEDKTKILAPTDGTVMDSAASSLVIQFPLAADLFELRVNGKIVGEDLVGRTEEDAPNGIVTKTWYGVTFQAGENTVTAQGYKNNQAIGNLAVIKLIAPGSAQGIYLKTRESRIPADGTSVAQVEGWFIDENETPVNWGESVTLQTTAGEFIGADAEPDIDGFQVKPINGRFEAQLRSGIEAQTVRLEAQTLQFKGFTSIQFETNLRKHPLVSGFVDFRLGQENNNFYSRFEDFLRETDSEYSFDVSSAVFATGSVGAWSVTGAFNSDRPLNQDCNCENRLFGGYQASENPYPVYGDNSTFEKTAPSTDSLYLRLEKSSGIANAAPDFFMWGDYNIDEFSSASQKYSGFTRQLHGFKSNYNLGDLQFTGFYAINLQGFQRDTIVPDGTSGYYFLSRRLLVGGSEEIFLELEALDRPGTVVKRTRLKRAEDYDIDYDRGSLLFNYPITQTVVNTEGEIFVQRIVSTYQYESTTKNDTSILGGRLKYNIDREGDDASWLGSTYWREDQGDTEFTLYGVDGFYAFGDWGKLKAEYAHSSNFSTFLGDVSGSAYNFEFDAKFGDTTGRLFYNTTDAGFSNLATASFVPGQTRYGGDVNTKVTNSTTLRLQYDHEDNFGIAPRSITNLTELLNPLDEPVPGGLVDNTLDTVTAGIQQDLGKAKLSFDYVWRKREDRLSPNALTSTSSQLRSQLIFPLTSSINIRAFNTTTLSQNGDALVGDRTGIGIDWKATEWATVKLDHQWLTSGTEEGQSVTNWGIDLKKDFKVWENAIVTGQSNFVNGLAGWSGTTQLGFKQELIITSGLKLDFNYQHTFDNFGRTANGKQFAQPYAVGSGASSLSSGSGDSYSIGLDYTDNPDFKLSAGWAYRNNSTGSNSNWDFKASGQVSRAIAALAEYQRASAANQLLEDLDDSVTMRVGLAYRDPANDTLNALLKYEYRKNPASIPDTLLFGAGTGAEDRVLSAEAIYAPNWQWEFYGKYARRMSTTFLASDFTADSQVSLKQFRAVYRLGYQMDLLGEVRWISQPSAGYDEMGLVLEAGYYITPELRLYAGYNMGDVNDRDFSGVNAAGAYTGLMVKLNGLFDGFGQPTAPPQQVQALVKSEPLSGGGQ